MINKEPASGRRGRPRSFDRDEVLAKAAEAFWESGYEGTSIADLTEAMGITPQSLYTAFNSKADLYREALGWYQERIGAETVEALRESDVAVALTRVLAEAAHAFTLPDRPPGCMISTALLNCGAENQPVADQVGAMRGATLAAIRTRIERGIDEGQLRSGTDAEGLARFVGAMIQGMSVQARDGATEAELMALARHGIAEVERHRPRV